MIDTDKLSVAVRTKRGGRTLEEAAQESGIPTSTLNKIENKGKPGADTLFRVCDWLGMDPRYFRLRPQPAAA